MVDLITVAESAARDPLLGAFVLMATGVLVSSITFQATANLACFCTGPLFDFIDLASSAQWYCSL